VEVALKIEIPFSSGAVEAEVPEGTEILRLKSEDSLPDPAASIKESLVHPIGSESLLTIARRKKAANPKAKACLVVSDKTRPVPYKGRNGILSHILETLSQAGYAPSDILILVATGMHERMDRVQHEAMLGSEIFSLGISVQNHDCADASNLVMVGSTVRGTEAVIDRRYLEADLKILTGLVESHFMAGASGGRKSICPGLLGEAGTLVFHGPALMSHPNTRDLLIEGNPVHEESLAVARMAGADFIVNVTVDARFAPTGIFSGDLESAHAAAVDHLRKHVGIPVGKPFDLVITHGGFVASNHYQAAKAGVAALAALPASGGSLIMVADNRDAEPIGSDGYRITLSLLKKVGPRILNRILASPDWEFIVDQWETQMWAKVLDRVMPEDFVYFAPQLGPGDRRILPGMDGRALIGGNPSRTGAEVPDFIDAAIRRFLSKRGAAASDVASGKLRVAFLADGPYGIPIPIA
jgi:nickel-dependent lactate racemase